MQTNQPAADQLPTNCCCFTGHRPEKLHASEAAVRAALEVSIRAAIADGYEIFLTGMAPGVDLWAGQIVLHLRAEFPTLKLLCAVPYPSFGHAWREPWHSLYQWVFLRADATRCICTRPFPGCYQRRNQWMVDHSTLVIAVYHGAGGGTRNTIDYARRRGVPVRYATGSAAAPIR